MDNKEFLKAYEYEVTIKSDSLLVNSNLYTRIAKVDTVEVTVEYKLPNKNKGV